MKGRRVQVELRRHNGSVVVSAEAEDIDNADTTAPLIVAARAECDLGHWHDVGLMALASWGHR